MAIGIIEIQSLVNAYKAYDVMVKTADIELIHERKAIGGWMVTMVFQGSVSDLTAAFDRVKGMFEGSKRLKVAEVVPNPAIELMEYFEKGVFS
jgi:microcompartment protein CcmL/EutN